MRLDMIASPARSSQQAQLRCVCLAAPIALRALPPAFRKNQTSHHLLPPVFLGQSCARMVFGRSAGCVRTRSAGAGRTLTLFLPLAAPQHRLRQLHNAGLASLPVTIDRLHDASIFLQALGIVDFCSLLNDAGTANSQCSTRSNHAQQNPDGRRFSASVEDRPT